MTLNPMNLARSAAGLLIGAVAVAWVLAGGEFALGLAVSGACALINYALGVVVFRQMFAAALGQGVRGRWPGVMAFVLKFVFLAGGILLLISVFPPVSVLLGCSVVVFAATAWGVLSLRTSISVGEA